MSKDKTGKFTTKYNIMEYGYQRGYAQFLL